MTESALFYGHKSLVSLSILYLSPSQHGYLLSPGCLHTHSPATCDKEFSKRLLTCLVFTGLGEDGLNCSLCQIPCCLCEKYVLFHADFLLLQLISWIVLHLCSGMSGFLY